MQYTEWTTPKTDWVATDYINYTDINRIINNLRHLRERAIKHYVVPEFTQMTDKLGFSDMFYADEMNTIEDNVDVMNTLCQIDIGTKTVYSGNAVGPDYVEFNRIENALLNFYNWLLARPERNFTWNFGPLGVFN